MKTKIIAALVLLFFSMKCFAQVGIGNTNPNATLDISASDATNPSNEDGMLIPRIDEFPISNPGAPQDGMMVFVTGNGSATEGFYYWDNATTSWVSFAGGVNTQNTLDEAYDEGGAGAGRTITADNGAVEIEGNGGLRVESTNETHMLFVDGTNDAVGIGEMSPLSPLHVGIQTTWDLSYANTGQDGLYLRGSGDNSGLNAVGASIGFGPPSNVRSDQRKAAIASIQTGGDIDLLGLGFFVHGNAINMTPMVEGMRLNHQGFLGINNTDPDATLDVVGTMQFVDGNEATGYVLSSDATGNASWTDPATLITDTDDQFIDEFNISGGNTLNLSLDGDGQPTQQVDLSIFLDNTDDQTIDGFALIGTTLNLSLENDGQPNQLVDLSSLNTDDQTIDTFTLTGTNLNLSLEDDGQPLQTVDLSSLQDGTGTDDQTIDAFSLVGTTLNLSLESDGQPNQTVDLSSLQDGTGTDDQTIDNFSLVGTTLRISLEDDGQPLQTVDLSSLQDGTGTDDQSIDTFSFNSTTNVLTLEIENDGIVPQTVDLSSLSGANTLDDAYDEGGAGAGRVVNVDNGSIEFLGSGSTSFTNVITHNSGGNGIQINTSGDLNSGGQISHGIEINNANNTNGSFSRNYGIFNRMTVSGTAANGVNYGFRNWFLPAGSASGTQYGFHSENQNGGGSLQYGFYSRMSNASPATHFGYYSEINVTNGLDKFGYYSSISTTSPGIHYGVYSDAQKASGYAAYFIGRTSLGDGTSNRYIMPGADGTNGQVITTNGAGNLSWTSVIGENTSASNGLSETGDDVRLGGTLIQNTTITQGANSLDINLNSTGDFAVQDNGVDAFIVEDTGDVGIGLSNPNSKLDILETDNTDLIAVNITKTDNFAGATYGIYTTKTAAGSGRSHAAYNLATATGTGNNYAIYNRTEGTGAGQKYGVFNELNSSATGSQYGTRNWVRGTTSAQQFGTFNNMDNGSTGDQYGVYNGMRSTNASNMYGVYNEFLTANSSSTLMAGVRNRFTGGTPGTNGFAGTYTDFALTANGTYYGTRTEYGSGATGNGNKYGSYNLISSSAGGTHYGTYNEVSASNGWAGYFVGRNYVSEAIGINNPNPDGRIDIIHNSTGAASPHIMITAQNANSGARITFDNEVETASNWVLFARADDTQADSRFNIYQSAIARNILVITGDGQVGINTNNPNYALELPNNATSSVGQGRANAWVTYSDSRIKKNQKELKYGLSEILQMTPKSYLQFASEFENGNLILLEGTETEQIGFIAQELKEIIPEATYQPKNENTDLWSVDYEKIIPIAVNAIKELNTKNEQLQEKINLLEAQLSKYESLEKRLSALEGNTATPITETATVSEAKE